MLDTSAAPLAPTLTATAASIDDAVAPLGLPVAPTPAVLALDNAPLTLTTPNSLTVALVVDDGLSLTDHLTSQPDVQGRIVTTAQVDRLLGKFKHQNDYTDITDVLAPGANGESQFEIDRARLAQVFGSELADGFHRLDLQAVFTSGNRSDTSLDFTLDSSIANPQTTSRRVRIDDRETGSGLHQFTYGGTWNWAQEGNAYGRTASWTNENNAFYEVKFNGTQANLYSIRNPWGGIAGITVDDGPEVLVDTYGTDWQNRVFFQTQNLSAGEHTIRVRVTGQKNALSGDDMISIDAIEITAPLAASGSQTAPINLARTGPLHFSPFTWLPTSNGAQTSNAGAYVKFRFNGTQATLNIDNSGLTAFPLLDVFVDGQQTRDQLWTKTATNGQLSIFSGSAGNHDVVVYFRRREIFDAANPTVAAQKINDWNNDAEHWRLTGVTVAGGTGFLENTFRRSKTAIFYGDSITEGGLQTYVPTSPDRPTNYPYANVPNGASYTTYAARLGDLLNVDYGQVGWSGSGWRRPITPTGQPTFGENWLKYNGLSTTTRNFAPQPDYVFVNLGTNDTPFNGGENPANFNVTDAAYNWLKDARQRMPQTDIFIIYPFNQTKNAELRQAIIRYRNEFPQDRKVHALNLGAEGARGLPVPFQDSLYIPEFSLDAVHPSASRNKSLAGLLFDAVKPRVGLSSTVIDDRQTASGSGVNNVVYTGNWQSVAEASSLNQDNHRSATANDTYEVEFYGSRVQLFGTKGLQNGIAAVSIDGGPEVLVDLYNATTQANSLLYQTGTLSRGFHKVRVRVTGQRNTSATGNAIALDKLVVV